MYAPLSEYVEMKLEEAFCKEYRVMSTNDRPTYEWEDYKEAFSKWLIMQFYKRNRQKKFT